MQQIIQKSSLISLALAGVLSTGITIAAPNNEAEMVPMKSRVNSGKATVQKIKAPAQQAPKMIKQQSTQTVSPASGTFSTGQGKADLVIQPYYQNNSSPEGHPGQSYCEHALSGGTPQNIWFYVKNIGHGASQPAQVRVLFNTFMGGGQSGVHNQLVPVIAKGASQVVKVALPQGCYPSGFSTTCHFRIVADSTYQNQEVNESNNHVDSKCVSPAG
jgi:hypothetical protein